MIDSIYILKRFMVIIMILFVCLRREFLNFIMDDVVVVAVVKANSESKIPCVTG